MSEKRDVEHGGIGRKSAAVTCTNIHIPFFSLNLSTSDLYNQVVRGVLSEERDALITQVAGVQCLHWQEKIVRIGL